MADSTQRERVYWHELRAPIGTLVTLLDVACQGYAGEAPAELVDLLQRAKRQADRLAEMVAAAHDLARLRRGELAVRREPVDLAAATQAALDAVDAAARARGVLLELRAPAPVAATCDSVLLRRSLECLLRAAIEGSKKGSAVTVTVEVLAREGLAAARAELSEPASPQGLAAAFTDQCALGIRGGTGLGLLEAKLLVEAMGGSAQGAERSLEVRLPAPG